VWRTEVKATRLATNPLITVKPSTTLGANVNGPSLIRVPSWVSEPLGRYYLYFSGHRGLAIRLAYADAIGGPWRIRDDGVVHVTDTAFRRPLPDPAGPRLPYTHVASPEVRVEESRRKIVMWYHGFWTEGKRWPDTARAARRWLAEHRYGQFTQAAESGDGLQFQPLPSITRQSYLRVFTHQGVSYGMARLGQLLRAKEPLGVFETGPNPFRGGPYANRVRHVALLKRGKTLLVFFSGIGDAPERILVSTIDMMGDWAQWRASTPVDVLIPQASYECPDLPVTKSSAGDADHPVRELRDPAVFEEGGKTYLLYAICGEQGIAAAELTLRSYS
jgi:hypothetical protein